MEFLPKAFEFLSKYNQFIVYVLTSSKSRPGKMDKLPADYRSGAVTNAHNPEIWTDAQTAIKTAKALGVNYGVGFVFTENDPFFFLDIDDCAGDGVWLPHATALLTAFAGAAYEVSSSGRGLHVIGTGVVPPHSCRNAEHKLELYTSGRFVALTGKHAGGDSGFDCSLLMPWLVEAYFPPGSSSERVTPDSLELSTAPVPEWNGNTDDDELLARMLNSKPASAIFSDGVTFRDLWEANEPVLAKAYPANDTDNYNRSAADAALAQRLAFWTGNHGERIQRLMERSALKRDKWEREDYLPRTIKGVCGRQKEYLRDRQPEYTIRPDSIQPEDTPKPKLVSGSTFLTIDQQIDYFTGCVYVLDEHKIMIPDGQLLTPDRFKAYYGGNMMPLDVANTKTTRNAFEAFTESQAFRSPRADSCVFRPDCSPGGIILDEGRRMANIYHPVKTERMSGDIQPFLRHLGLLFPVDRDREIFLAYLAAIIQHKGIKFQWCPLIQGAEGNGKTFFSYAVAFAIGQRYSHFPKAAEIASKFNDWLYAHIFIGVEDIYFADAKMEVIEALKPMVTGRYLEIEAKGGTKITRQICANFILNSNHKDALRKTRNDRRFAPFFTPQQTDEDIARQGMDKKYFRALIDWSMKQHGYAMIHEYLATYVIPDDYNPATGERAPKTSSTEAAIALGVGRIEQEIVEAVAEGLPGFRGGWVSSSFLNQFLVRIKAERIVSVNRRREMMESLGYQLHPLLLDGRITRIVQPDGNKPRLYLKTGHPALELQSVDDIAKAYTDAQTKD